MKRTLLIALSVIMVLCFAGCNKTINDEFPNDLTVSSEPKYPVATLSPDWPSYDTAEEIVNASSNIYAGEVTGVTFEIVDMRTGKVADPSQSDNTNLMLYTIYTVSVTKSYKGKNEGEIRICHIGGIAGYDDDKQHSLLKSSGLLDQYGGIPAVKHTTTLATGKEYLFCTSRKDGDFDFIINKTQFAHSVNSQNFKAIVSAVK